MCQQEKNVVKFDQMTTKGGRIRRNTCRDCTKNGKGRYAEIKKLLEQNLKKCTKCNAIKDLNNFYLDKSSKDQRMDYCADCWKKRNKEWSQNNQEKEKEYDERYNKENKEKLLLYRQQYNSRAEVKEKQNKYRRERRKEDPEYKLRYYLRTRLNKAIKRNSKVGSAVSDLGCSIKELKEHIEKQFQTGMSWENHAPDGWHIDHIVPLSSFDLTDREQFLKACHYTNLQPLWWRDNLSKGDKNEENYIFR